jgi:hypothetical protein
MAHQTAASRMALYCNVGDANDSAQLLFSTISAINEQYSALQ